MKKSLLVSGLIVSLLSFNSIAAVKAPKVYKNGMVASDHYLASKAGTEVLKLGGNAVDAAVATSLVLSVVRNQSTGIGGGGFMVLHLANGDNKVVDYREIAPKKAHRDMYLDENKKPIKNLSTTGYKAVAVPGNLAGLEHVLKKYGTMKFKDLAKYAISYAENGFEVDKHFVNASKTVNDRGALNELKEVFFNNQKPKEIGDIQKNLELAQTLKVISDKGIQEFYKGSIADKIDSEMKKNGGLITKEDLSSYAPKERQILKGNYKGYEVLTMPPPSSGGIALLECLNILEPYNLSWSTTGFGSSKHVQLVTEAMKHAFADRAEFLGDPDFVKVPVDRLISKDYANTLRKSISLEKTQPSNTYGLKYLNDDHGTTHYSIIDKFGNAVAATETVNTLFGSQVVIKGTGIVMNNEMDDFSVQAGVPNAFGLIGNENNSIQAGKKPLSSMTPTIVLKDGKPFIISGGSGGPRIITGTLHSILNVIDFEMNAEEAVSAPRFHHQWVPNKIFIEKDMPEDVRENLIKKGHELSLGEAESAVQTIVIKDGNITGASDPRKGGFPEGY